MADKDKVIAVYKETRLNKYRLFDEPSEQERIIGVTETGDKKIIEDWEFTSRKKRSNITPIIK